MLETIVTEAFFPIWYYYFTDVHDSHGNRGRGRRGEGGEGYLFNSSRGKIFLDKELMADGEVILNSSNLNTVNLHWKISLDD